MMKHGGGFVQCLGELLQHADYDNVQKIHDTWPGYWNEYAEIARKEG